MSEQRYFELGHSAAKARIVIRTERDLRSTHYKPTLSPHQGEEQG